MNANIINPFIDATFTFLEKAQRFKISKGRLSLVNSPVVGDEVNTILKLNGYASGQVIFSMSLNTAKKIASAMLQGLPVDELDELAQSAINEMGNIITGLASCLLTGDGLLCTITPPLLMFGKKVKTLFSDLPAIVIPINSDFGEITMLVELREAG